MCIRDRACPPFESLSSLLRIKLIILSYGKAIGDFSYLIISFFCSGSKARTTEAPAGICPIAVSYTHLDVYKRQKQYWMQKIIWPCRLQVMSGDNCSRLAVQNLSVSYTHLDVYKRQIELCLHFLTIYKIIWYDFYTCFSCFLFHGKT